MPKVNEVWETQAGRLALIVASIQHNGGLAMLWFDGVSGELTVSDLLDRPKRLTLMDPEAFFVWNSQHSHD